MDWNSVVLHAPVDTDLTKPEAWKITNDVGNPGTTSARFMRTMFSLVFRTDQYVQNEVKDDDKARTYPVTEGQDRNVAPLYWMEGVIFQAPKQGIGSNLATMMIMRINNNQECNTGALLSIDDNNMYHFEQFTTHFPGASIAHPAVSYDSTSGLVWAISNENRNPRRDWGPKQSKFKDLHIVQGSLCEADRSTLTLYASVDGRNWIFVRRIYMGRGVNVHYTYPDMVFVEEDLHVVTRANPMPREGDKRQNHDSKFVLHAVVKGFRSLIDAATMKWLNDDNALPPPPNIPKL